MGGDYGMMGNGGSQDEYTPIPLEYFDADVTLRQVIAGHAFNLVLTKEGKIFSWGKNDSGQLGLGGGLAMDMTAVEQVPSMIETLEDQNVVQISAGRSHAAALTDKNELYIWGLKQSLEPSLYKLPELDEDFYNDNYKNILWRKTYSNSIRR